MPHIGGIHKRAASCGIYTTQVELVSRVCRQWTDQHKEILDKTAVKEGEIIIKAGLQV